MLKRTLILSLILFLLFSCSQSKDERARERVEHYCDLNFHKYLPLGFKKLEPVFQPYSETTEFSSSQATKIKLTHQLDSMKHAQPDLSDSISNVSIKSLDHQIASIDQLIAQQTKNYKGPQIGWSLAHAFTYKDTANRVIKKYLIFTMDINLAKVISTRTK